jgi:hypothetical protein
VDWVTPVTTFNCLSSTYVAYGNEASLELVYGHLCRLAPRVCLQGPLVTSGSLASSMGN